MPFFATIPMTIIRPIKLATLKMVPVPDPSKLSFVDMRRIVSLVEKRLSAKREEYAELEATLDVMVADLYGLSAKEKRSMGIGEA